VLPVSLQHVVIKCVLLTQTSVQPLLALTQLKTLTITRGLVVLSHLKPSHGHVASDSKYNPSVMVALTQLPSLSHVIILEGPRPTEEQMQQFGLQAVFDALPMDWSGLGPPAATESGPEEGMGEGEKLTVSPVGVPGHRVCSMWAGVRVLLDVLMGNSKAGA
jgi:hypothetical protein